MLRFFTATTLQVSMIAIVLCATTVSTAAPTTATTHPTPLTASNKFNLGSVGTSKNQQLMQQQVELNTARLQQLEQANQDALARNQELQLMNDNLTVQVQVLQSERSAQMFLYGAATLIVGAFIGFLLANYMLGKRKRRW